MDNKVLQEKLQKFVGFKEVRFNEPPHEVCWIEDKDGHMFSNGVPDLVNSLDAQQEHIYPKLIELGKYHINKNYIVDLKTWNTDIYIVGSNYDGYNTGYDSNEAISFGLAVEKIINRLEKNRNNE